MFDVVSNYYNYFIVIVLMMMGLWAMIAKRNLIKKCIGMAIFQTGIILFYISMGAKKGSTIPIIGYDSHHNYPKYIEAIDYANPLTQILMLTAIVVGVATIGLALTLAQNIYRQYGTLEEPEILEKLS